MIITRTPYRISFFGGGTDYPAWYRQHGGAVLAASIDKYCYLTCRHLPPFFEHSIRAVYSEVECCRRWQDIKHPVIREALGYAQIERGIEIHHDGDLPARSGMGSSSSFTVGLLHALHAWRGEAVTRRQLAHESIFLEQELLGEPVGSQDQVLAAYGGLNHVVFDRRGEFEVRPAAVSRPRLSELNDHLMLFYTGVQRSTTQVAGSYVRRLHRSARQLHRLAQMVDEGLAILSGSHNLAEFGSLLHEAWVLKSSISSQISTAAIDGVYEEALSAGALGGKLLGAGGGGFLLLFVRPEEQEQVKRRLSPLVHVPFRFEGQGSRVIFHESEPDFPACGRIPDRPGLRLYSDAVRQSA